MDDVVPQSRLHCCEAVRERGRDLARLFNVCFSFCFCCLCSLETDDNPFSLETENGFVVIKGKLTTRFKCEDLNNCLEEKNETQYSDEPSKYILKMR